MKIRIYANPAGEPIAAVKKTGESGLIVQIDVAAILTIHGRPVELLPQANCRNWGGAESVQGCGINYQWSPQSRRWVKGKSA